MALSPVIPANRAAISTIQVSTFHVAGMFFGVDVLQVQEVLRFQPMTPIPLAPGVIEGLINLRGQIVTAIDMRRRLGLPPRPDDQPPINIVVRTPEGAVSLLVDDIGDVMEVNAADYEEAPSSLPNAIRDILRGVYKLPNRLLLMLDEQQTTDLSMPITP